MITPGSRSDVRYLAGILALVVGCGRAADARVDAESTEGSEGAAIEETEALHDGTEMPVEPIDAPTAEAEIDAAIAAARDRAEEDRLALARQKSELDALTRELDARLAGIEQLEQRLDALVGVGKVAQERRRERIDVLANLLATMPPQAAATMLAQMSDVDAQELVLAVAQNDKRKAAKLIATMPAGRAAEIGQRYLRRDPKALGEADLVDAAPTSTPAAAPASAPIEDAPPLAATPSEPAAPPTAPQEASP